MKALTVMILACALIGCVNMGTTGQPVKPDPLSQMQLNISSKGQVRALLGEPRGRGGSQAGPDKPPQEIWFYHYMVFTYPVKMEMLLVFFEADRYNGHLWFSSEHRPGLP